MAATALWLPLAPFQQAQTLADTAPAASTLGQIGSLTSDVTSTVSALVATAFSPSAAGPPPSTPVRVALVSSGVDTKALPASISPLTLLGNGGDSVGYGTMAASAVLQGAPGAQITSIGIYPNGRFDPGWQSGALGWLDANKSKFDVVVLAYPPSEFLDPISASMAKGEWNIMADAISDVSLKGSQGQPFYGLPLSNTLRAQATQGEPYYTRAALDRFAYLLDGWIQAKNQVQALTDGGVPVVAPAGDLGAGPQTIFGLANLPNVLTVGSSSGGLVSPKSSRGPAIDGTVKPNLVAPSGLVSVLSPSSPLATYLSSKGLLDSSLVPDWPFGAPPSSALARLDTSLVSASYVSAIAGLLHAQGVADVPTIQGSFTACSLPIPGTPVWAQGAGLLRCNPDPSVVASRPIPLGSASLGLQPDSGPWASTVGFTRGVSGVTPTVTDLMGVGVDGHPSYASGVAAPGLSGSVSQNGITINAGLGSGSYQGGLYCGYSQVSLPATSGSVSPAISASGIPVDTQSVPTCLIQGTQLTAKSFYIHDTAAPNLTFGLLPAMPPGASLLDHVLTLLPVDPLATKIFFRVTQLTPVKDPADPDPKDAGPETSPQFSYAHFPNIPPGYFRVRQWSDYSAPITSSVTSDQSGATQTVNDDVGEVAGYQSFNALILTPLCSDPVAEVPPADYPSLCTKTFLQSVFDAGNQPGQPSHVAYEKPTGGYLVNPVQAPPDPESPTTLRLIFSFLKKMPGPGVSSRNVDLIDGGDLNWSSLDINGVLGLADLAKAVATGSPGAPSTSCPAVSVAGAACTLPPPSVGNGSTLLGSAVAWYPFNLTTPNYKAHMSLNFHYSVTNAFIFPVVIVGQDVNWGVVTPQGQFKAPSQTLQGGINVAKLNQPSGQASGDASFDFHMLPKGASNGYLVFVIAPPTVLGLSEVSAASISNMSFELDTWTNALWPATKFAAPYPVGTGHSFRVSSNMNRDPVKRATSTAPAVYQIQDPPRCRQVDNTQVNARVCEDWTVFVHSPGDDASVFDVYATQANAASGAPRSIVPDLQAAGASYFDPHRGVNDFSSALIIPTTTIAQFELSATIPFAFKTDGSHWEQLTLPAQVNRMFPQGVEFRIVDNVVGRNPAPTPFLPNGSLFGHVDGGVQVPPYVPFIANPTFLNIS